MPYRVLVTETLAPDAKSILEREPEIEVVADPFFGSTTANPLLILMKNSIEPGVLAEILKIGMECEETTETLLCQRSGAPASSPG